MGFLLLLGLLLGPSVGPVAAQPSDPATRLLWATIEFRGNELEARRALRDGANPNAIVPTPDDGHWPLLVRAVQRELPGIVKLLLAQPAIKPNLQNSEGTTALHMALQKADAATAKLLLARADIQVNVQNNQDETPLHIAAQQKDAATATLLLARADINVKATSVSGETPLHYAARAKALNVARHLLAHPDTNLLVRNLNDETPRDLAPANSKVATLMETWWTANQLFYAAWFGQTATVQDLLDKGTFSVNARDGHGRTALYLAARHGHLATVQALLQAGARAMRRNNAGQTPEQAAQAAGHPAIVTALQPFVQPTKDLWAAIRARKPGQVQAALDAGADVNALDDTGEPVLYQAVGKVPVLKVLLAHPGIPVNASAASWHKTARQKSALVRAAYQADPASVRHLLTHPHLNVNSRDAYRRTALHYAVLKNSTEVAALLLAHPDISLELKDQDGWTPRNVAQTKNSPVVALINAWRKDNLLFYAARIGYTDTVKKLLERGTFTVDAQDAHGRTVLHIAARYGHRATVKALLARADVEVDIRDTTGQTPLHHAAAQGHTAIVTDLLHAEAHLSAEDTDGHTARDRAPAATRAAIDAYVQQATQRWDTLRRPLTFAASLAADDQAFVRRVLNNGLAVNVSQFDRASGGFLHYAAYHGYADLLTALLAHYDVDVNAPHTPGDPTTTPLLLMIRDPEDFALDAFTALLAHPAIEVNRQAGTDTTALHHAIRRGGHTAAVTALLTHPALDLELRVAGHTALHAAAWRGHTDIVAALLPAGANVHTASGGNVTALRLAELGGHTATATTIKTYIGQMSAAWWTAVEARDVAKVRRLLGNGMPVDAKDGRGNTALHYAALGMPNMVAALLDAGADVHATRANGQTALHQAARSSNSKILAALLDAGADVNAADTAHGQTPLHLAAFAGRQKILAALLDAGADIDATKANGQTALHLAALQGHLAAVTALLDAGAQLNLQDKGGSTALHHAATPAVVTALLHAGADPTIKRRGLTAQGFAQWHGRTAVVAAFKAYFAGMAPQWWAAVSAADRARVRALLGNGIDVNLRDDAGRNALYHLPDTADGRSLATLLLEAGAQVRGLQDTDGHGPIAHLESTGRAPLAQTLRTYLHTTMYAHWLPAARTGDLVLLQRLFSNGMRVGWTTADDPDATPDPALRTALHAAAAAGQTKVVKLLLAQASLADVLKQDSQSQTARALAEAAGHTALVHTLDAFQWWAAVEADDVNAATLVLDTGFDGNQLDDSGQTGLHLAVEAGHTALVTALLARADIAVDTQDATDRTALHVAVEAGHAALVTALIQAGANLNLQDDAGQTALHVAAAHGQAAIATALLRAGTDTTIEDTNEQTALHVAQAAGETSTVTAIETYLGSLSPAAWWQAVTDGDTAELTRMLNNGWEVNYQDTTDGRTALHKAAAAGNSALVTWLLEAGGSVILTDTNDQTVQEVAAAAGHTTIATELATYAANMPTQWWQAVKAGDAALVRRLIRNGVDVNAQDTDGRPALHLAALADDTPVFVAITTVSQDVDLIQVDHDGKSVTNHLIDYYVAHRDQDWPNKGKTLEALLVWASAAEKGLRRAAARGDVARVEYHLGNGVSPANQDRHGKDALHYAAAAGHTEVVRLIVPKFRRFLFFDGEGNTALSLARAGGHTEAAALILAHSEHLLRVYAGKGNWGGVTNLIEHFGVDNVNAQDAQGRTALHYALEAGYLEMVNWLGGWGTRFVDVTIEDHNGQTPLDLTTQAGRDYVTKHYTNQYPKYFFQAVQDGNLDLVKKLVEAGVEVNKQDSNASKFTALHWAARSGRPAVVQFLLDQGMDVNIRDGSSGTTPLHQVLHTFHSGDTGPREIIDILLTHPNIDLSLLTRGGNGYLHYALVGKVPTEAMKVLIDHPDIDVNAANRDGGLTALILAIAKNRPSIVSLLLAHEDIDMTLKWKGNRPLIYARQETRPLLTAHIQNRLPGDLRQAAREGDAARVGRILEYDIDVNTSGALHEAVRAGHTDIVTLLLAHSGIDVNLGWPLHEAVKAGHTDIVTLLLAHPDINVNDTYRGRTALHEAAAAGHAGLVTTLLTPFTWQNIKADFTWDAAEPDINAQDNEDQTALHLAAAAGQTAIVTSLLQAGAHLSLTDVHGQTAEDLATAAGQTATAQVLADYAAALPTDWFQAVSDADLPRMQTVLSNGIDVNRQDQNGRTALYHLPLSEDASGVVGVLINAGALVSSEVVEYWRLRSEGNTAAFYPYSALWAGETLSRGDWFTAAAAGDVARLTQIYDSGGVTVGTTDPNNGEQTALHQAAAAGQVAAVRFLLDRATLSEVDQTDTHGQTARDLAQTGGQRAVVGAIDTFRWWAALEAGNETIIAALITAGFDVNRRNAAGQTALHVAAAQGETPLVTALLQAGVDPLVRDQQGRTATDVATEDAIIALLSPYTNTRAQAKALLAAARDGDEATVRQLLQAGADINTTGANGWTPLHLAGSGGHRDVVAVLLQQDRLDVNLATTDTGETALQLTITYGHTRIVAALLGHADIDVTGQDDYGYTALHLAVYDAYTEMATLLLDHVAAWTDATAVSDYLDLFTDDDQTALHLAAEANLDTIVLRLLEAGADATLLDADSRTAREVAEEQGNTEALEAFQVWEASQNLTPPDSEEAESAQAAN